MKIRSSLTDPVARLVEDHRPGFSLAAEFYRDPVVYAADVERIFVRTWHYAGHVSQLPSPGSYLLDDYAGESIIVVRGQDSRIRAFYNVCRHRGSRLVTEPAGCVRALRCPYHAWSFGLDGALRSAPAMPDDFDPAAYGLKSCPVRVLEGMILVCPGTPADDIEPALLEMEDFLRPHAVERTKVAATIHWPTKANWKLVMENFFECYHCGAAHPEYCSVMAHALKDTTANPQQAERYNRVEEAWAARARALGRRTDRIDRLDSHGCMVLRFPVGENKLAQTREGRAVAPLLGEFKEYDGGVTGGAIRPALNFYVNNDHVVILSFVPRGPQETDTVITWLVREDAQEGRDYDVNEVTWLWKVTTDEDKKIVEDNQAGVNSRAYEPGPYSTKVEQGPPRFHRWYFRHLLE
jgi:Rieske 2Fe-2S family protein